MTEAELQTLLPGVDRKVVASVIHAMIRDHLQEAGIEEPNLTQIGAMAAVVFGDICGFAVALGDRALVPQLNQIAEQSANGAIIDVTKATCEGQG